MRKLQAVYKPNQIYIYQLSILNPYRTTKSDIDCSIIYNRMILKIRHVSLRLLYAISLTNVKNE
jgi:hypothetical protein